MIRVVSEDISLGSQEISSERGSEALVLTQNQSFAISVMAAAAPGSALYPPLQSLAALGNDFATAVAPQLSGADTPSSPGSLQVLVAVAPLVDQLDQMAVSVEQAAALINADPQQAVFNGLTTLLWRVMVEQLTLWDSGRQPSRPHC